MDATSPARPIPDTGQEDEPTTTTYDDMPAEAMSFNGEYIENQIDGYRTLYVRGRESMLAEINAYETGVRDGTGITSKRFPARELVVGYLLHAKSNEAFREAYNTLNGILNTQDAQIIFHDEEDKYFVGTPEGLDEIESGRNFVQGEIIIYCADPFKYSVEEFAPSTTTTATSTTFTIDYAGTYKARPTLEADFFSDCGYVQWSLPDTGKLIQLGDPSETEGESYTKSEMLIYENFRNAPSLSDWDENYSNIWIVPSGSSYGLSGKTTYDSDGGDTYLTAYDFMSSPGGWTGTSISQEVPADSNGDKGASNWTVNWTLLLSNGDGGSANTNRGGIEVLVTDSDNNLIAGVVMYKGSSDSGTTGNIMLCTANQSSTKTGIDYSRKNSRFGSGGSCTMTKTGSVVSFNLGGLSYSLTDSSINSVKGMRLTLVFLKLSDYSHMMEGFFYTSLYKNNVSSWRDVTNSFSDGDVAVADCESGEILINGAENASYGTIENDWESFYLEPGSNRIRFYRSSWASSETVTKIRYREVYL